MVKQDKEFKTLEQFLKYAKGKRDTSGLSAKRRATGDHVEVQPDEHKYHNHVHGYFGGSSVHAPHPPSGIANQTLGNIKAFT